MMNKSFLSKLKGVVDLVFIVCMWSTMALCRWSFIVYPLALNPDEVQAGANALRILGYGLSWDALDGTTVGPLNSLILLWPHFLGADVTLSTIRMTALTLLSLTVLFTYLTVRALSGRFYAILLSIPLVAFYSFNTNPEFQHYSSELFSLTLITAAIYLCIRIFYISIVHPLEYRLAIGILGISLGAIPFAKIQAAPVAFTIFFFALYFLFSQKNHIKKQFSLFLFIAAGLLPAAILLLPLVAHGLFYHFWNSYIIWPTLYVKTPLSVNALYQLIGNEPLLVLIFSLAFCLLILLVLFKPVQPSHKNIYLVWSLFFVCIVCAIFFSVARPGNMYPHYLMFLPPPILMMIGYFSIRSEPPYYLKYFYQLFFFGLVMFFICPRQQEQANTVQEKPSYLFEWYAPRLFDYLSADKTDRFFIWGWMPQWYLVSGLTPASRESMTNNQLTSSALQSYFKDRLLSDLTTSKPAYIIDAVAGKSFGFNASETQGLNSFDALAKFVNSNYVRIHGIVSNPKCARTYLRKDKFSSLSDQLVRFRSVSSSANWSDEYGPQNIDDYSVTEDTCTDYWLLPDRQSGYLDIKFTETAFVKKILILNTHNGAFMNMSSSHILIELMKGGSVVKKIHTQVKDYPYWTEIILDTPIASNALRLTVLSWKGHGGGINEVKVLK